ncbi:40S ribosomal protein S13 [Pseudoloma neurophilia]|uniref:40S ribosomal protein S13 n=1 Tax=Pseudoloma neurophilia TaxID=146866 RepID=A0A0R0M2C9_9MICR|nr:40S ribosomal protein S13 [Pseudoloma neurophilia]
MARMHSNNKGKAQSVVPYHSFYPSHVTKTKEEIIAKICTLGRKNIVPSMIGNILRDEDGIGRISDMTHTTMTNVLRIHNLQSKIPEDLNALVKKCTNMRAHLERFKNDNDQKYRLIQTESRMYRLARYYKKKGRIDDKWKPSFRLASSQ